MRLRADIDLVFFRAARRLDLDRRDRAEKAKDSSDEESASGSDEDNGSDEEEDASANSEDSEA